MPGATHLVTGLGRVHPVELCRLAGDGFLIAGIGDLDIPQLVGRHRPRAHASILVDWASTNVLGVHVIHEGCLHLRVHVVGILWGGSIRVGIRLERLGLPLLGCLPLLAKLCQTLGLRRIRSSLPHRGGVLH